MVPQSKKIKKHNDSQIQHINDENYVLPTDYGISQITLLTRDPFWIYAYWEINPKSLKENQTISMHVKKHGCFTVRIYDVSQIHFNGQNANHTFDVDIDVSHENEKYIQVWGDNANYCAEIGYRTASDDFLALARSNVIQTQRSSLAEQNTVTLMQTKEHNGSFLLENVKDYRKDTKNLTPEVKRYPVPEPNKKPKSPYGDQTPLSIDHIWNYYSKLTPLLQKVRPGREEKFLRRFNPEDLELNSYELGEPLISRQFKIKALRGSSDNIHIQQASSSDIHAEGSHSLGASENNSNQSRRPFFFEIGTELIVYGRTEPNASVYFDNRKIPLRSDGTFSMRLSLHEGTIPLNFMAQSHDKLDKRSIYTEATRSKTTYKP
ncbi:MAG: DUF4912 domain-containing protein [Candidatus Omnitrophica bacterium]|nr:DUF4912 domain-containing protein [Candidatus Omnitrophota bacterium]